jgi:hypothetical protein
MVAVFDGIAMVRYLSVIVCRSKVILFHAAAAPSVKYGVRLSDSRSCMYPKAVSRIRARVGR